MQGLEVPLVIQGRLVGRGSGNWLQGCGPLPSPPSSAPLAPPAAAGQALEVGEGGDGGAEGCGGWCNAFREL